MENPDAGVFVPRQGDPGLALVLVLITVAGVGYFLHLLLPEVPLVAAFALAAVLSPTDAVALGGIVGGGGYLKASWGCWKGRR